MGGKRISALVLTLATVAGCASSPYWSCVGRGYDVVPSNPIEFILATAPGADRTGVAGMVVGLIACPRSATPATTTDDSPAARNRARQDLQRYEEQSATSMLTPTPWATTTGGQEPL